MRALKAVLVFVATLVTLFVIIALPVLHAGHKAGWYTFLVLSSASALITAIAMMPTTPEE